MFWIRGGSVGRHWAPRYHSTALDPIALKFDESRLDIEIQEIYEFISVPTRPSQGTSLTAYPAELSQGEHTNVS